MYNYPHPENPHHSSHSPHHNPMHNPLTRRQKIWIGVAASATALGVGAAIILLPKQAQAAPVPAPVPDNGGGRPAKPPGSPPPFGDSCFPQEMGGTQRYEFDYWDAGGVVPARERIFAFFNGAGYQTPSDRSTMNDPGPDGALGGGDDVPNEEVRSYQRDYNRASRANVFPSMGGLWEDGLVGPCSLNGAKYVMAQLAEAGVSLEQWKAIARGELTIS